MRYKKARRSYKPDKTSDALAGLFLALTATVIAKTVKAAKKNKDQYESKNGKR